MTISNTAKPPFAPPRLDFPLLALVQADLIFTIILIAVPLPLAGTEFALDPAELVLLQVSCGLPYSGQLLLGGGLSDRFGGTPFLYIGLWTFGLSSLGAALSTSLELLVAMRAVQGMAAAIIAAVAHVAALYPNAQDFDHAMARWGGILVLGAAAGTVLSGVLTIWVSWRWMFAVPCVAVVGALFLRWRVFPVVQAHAPQGRLHIFGVVFGLLAFVTGGYALSMGSEHSWLSSSVAGTGILAVLAMVPYLAGLILGGGPAAGVVIRLGAVRAMILGLGLAAAGLELLSGFGPDYPAQIFPGLVILPAGTSMMLSSDPALLTQCLAPECKWLVAGVMKTAMELGSTAGMAAFLALTALRPELKDGWSLALMAAAGVALLITLYAALGQKERKNG